MLSNGVMELVLVNTSEKALVLKVGLMGFVHRCSGVLSDSLGVLVELEF